MITWILSANELVAYATALERTAKKDTTLSNEAKEKLLDAAKLIYEVAREEIDRSIRTISKKRECEQVTPSLEEPKEV